MNSLLKEKLDKLTINADRVTEEFMSLTAIDSLSFAERQMADRLTGILESLGFEVEEDNAGDYYHGNAGNLHAFRRGTEPGEPVLFAAHMDTVAPGIGKKAVLHEDGRITSHGETVLGADDLGGIAQILEAVRAIDEAGLSHRSIEILFSIAEEIFDKGTEVMDYSKIRAKEAYVCDLSGEIGIAALRSPSIIDFEVRMEGKAAHAGSAPEKGINAIAAVCDAVAGLRQGHADELSTLNVGTITGGSGINVVSDECRCRGEVRSFSHERALELVAETEKAFSGSAEKFGAKCSFKSSIDLYAYDTPETDPAVVNFVQVCEVMGIRPDLRSTFGGSDNNNFVRFGLDGLVISNGMFNIHSTDEYTTVQELVKGAVMVAGLILND